ncbi:protein-ribulosamine 3-kinase [Caenorhabditis elegans]|uniref:protein-ribulosamine 3-kinase n=1 Tax=Caenorhabditis elegans TaxID=6239 RepID=A0A0K3AUF9_CAEEL|nr:protein-ribulosamine 3-kinase [Caenorhabditis elegans]CTQ86670.1 protein-ribulosamine 3-kinase [Caenorhabditis elegans]|eukprot:NP_001299969.1 Uncharacterized protein CELE_Y116A8C.25 [Caenorhabditis elegans]
MDREVEAQIGLNNDEDLVIGELESLKAIQSTETILCPKPFGIIRRNGSYSLITSYIDFQLRKDWALAGSQLAKMHAKNGEQLAQNARRTRFVSVNSGMSDISKSEEGEQIGTENFGFHVTTCCGRLGQENDWTETWEEFFIRHRLKPQIDRLIETHNDRQLFELSEILYTKTAKLLKCRENVLPSLVHGDLWGGNWSMTTADGAPEPIIFDPSSSYSDPEFEFGIMKMFGGWTQDFENKYEKIIKTADGKNQRVLLYELYHNLNHWNHFGNSYRKSSIDLIKQILKF